MSGKKITDCSSGISPLGPSRKVKTAVRKAIKKSGSYPDAELERLRRLLSSKYVLSGSGILFSGSLEDLIYLVPAIIKPRRTLVVGPSNGVYEKASLNSGSAVSCVVGEGSSFFVADPGEIRDNLDGIDLLFIANPNRITGNLTHKQTLTDILKYASDKGIVSVVDESLIEFSGDDSFCGELICDDNVIVLRTTAYYYGLAGLEFAYAVSSPATIDRLAGDRKPQVSILAVEAAIAALKDRSYKRLLQEFIGNEKRRLIRALDRVDGIDCSDTDSNMVLIRMASPGETLRALDAAGFSCGIVRDAQNRPAGVIGVSVMEHDKNLKFMRTLMKRASNPDSRA